MWEERSRYGISKGWLHLSCLCFDSIIPVFRALSTFALYLSSLPVSDRSLLIHFRFRQLSTSTSSVNTSCLAPAANMQYTQLAVLALALGANARSQRRQWGGGNFDWAQWSQDNGAVAAVDEDSSESSTTATSASAVASTYSNSSSSTVPATTASATLASSGGSSGGSIPASSGTSALEAVQTIAAGESFDGGMFVYDRGQDCSGQAEGGDSDAVFILEVSYY